MALCYMFTRDDNCKVTDTIYKDTKLEIQHLTKKLIFSPNAFAFLV